MLLKNTSNVTCSVDAPVMRSCDVCGNGVKQSRQWSSNTPPDDVDDAHDVDVTGVAGWPRPAEGCQVWGLKFKV